jgi:curved DNA-binding protein CbpA
LEALAKKHRKNHYETLEIEKTADLTRIKAAYFRLVRKYQPDRFPEEFKELRAAYETLSDEKKRAEYDQIGALPKAAAPLYHQAQMDTRRGRHDRAADIYQKILQIYPELTKIREEYAYSLLAGNKYGKAMGVWESLCRDNPDNPLYLYECGETYLHRGWTKRAVEMFTRSTELDKGNVKYWEALIRSYMRDKDFGGSLRTSEAAIKSMGDRATIALYTSAFLLHSGEQRQEKAAGYLQNIVRLTQEGRLAEPNEDEESFYEILECIEDMDNVQHYPQLKQLADLLPRVKNRSHDRLEKIKRSYEILGLEGRGFDDVFTELLEMRNQKDNSEEAHKDRLAMEFHILKERRTVNPQLLRLKNEYPELYELYSSFFDEALSSRRPENMMRQRVKQLAKYNLRPIGYEEEDDDEGYPPPPQTVRRQTPKVGRNDPCPCGSGKKYKHCCGA